VAKRRVGNAREGDTALAPLATESDQQFARFL
jgi:hypothetical protein